MNDTHSIVLIFEDRDRRIISEFKCFMSVFLVKSYTKKHHNII